jgi:hypothetical protein
VLDHGSGAVVGDGHIVLFGRLSRGSRRGKFARSSYLFWGRRSFWPQISAHSGTQTSISTNTTKRPSPAIDLTCRCSRRSRRSMSAVSDTRRIPTPLRVWPSHRAIRYPCRRSRRCARRFGCAHPLWALLPLVMRNRSASLGVADTAQVTVRANATTAAKRHRRLACGGSRWPRQPSRNRRLSGFSVTAEGAHEIAGQRISYQYCRTSTRLVVDGASLASLRASPGRVPGGREAPKCGEPLGGGQSVGEVVTCWVG